MISSVIVLEDRPWPRESSRKINHVLGLESPGFGLGLGYEGPGIEYMHVKLFSGMFGFNAFFAVFFQLSRQIFYKESTMVIIL